MNPPTNSVDRVQQGHLYRHIFTGKKVLALANGFVSDALILDTDHPSGVSGRMLIQAPHLEALPMVYFGGRVP